MRKILCRSKSSQRFSINTLEIAFTITFRLVKEHERQILPKEKKNERNTHGNGKECNQK